jgi:protein-disulfide isomerase
LEAILKQVYKILLAASALSLTFCAPSAKQIKEAVEKDPSIVFVAIEKDPEKFIEVVNKAAQEAQKKQQEKMFDEEKKQRESEFANPLKPEIQDDRVIFGKKDAPITIVEYSDFECPFCKMLQENVIEKLQEKYKTKNDLSEGKIGIVYRHFAQSYHDKAPTEINASLCARELYGQNVYKNFISRIYNISPTNNGLDLALLPEIVEYSVNKAKEAKQEVRKDFAKEEFINCFNKMTYNQEFIDNSSDAITAGLEGTPYSLIIYKDRNENIVISKISGLKEVSYFERIIDKLLKIK